MEQKTNFSSIANIVVCFVGAICISFIIFSSISTLHGMFGIESSPKKNNTHNETIIEMVKTPPKQEQQVQQRIRKSQSTHTGPENGTGDKMSMRFSPDLIADAGGTEGVALTQQELSAEVFEEGQTDEAPEEEFIAEPAYSDRVRELNISGTVVVQFTITFEGKVNDLQIVSSPHPLLSTSVKKVFLTAKFKPAKNKGIPVNIRVKKSFQFDLE